jgi:hypothetical protein
MHLSGAFYGTVFNYIRYITAELLYIYIYCRVVDVVLNKKNFADGRVHVFGSSSTTESSLVMRQKINIGVLLSKGYQFNIFN